MAKFVVSVWGSHPASENNDCWGCAEFDTKAEAEAAAADPVNHFALITVGDCDYVEIDGPSFYAVRRNPYPERLIRAAKRADGYNRREAAMQAGMAFGCAGYNDEMGY